MSMTRQEAIKKFENQLRSAMVVLDGGFGTRPGESDRLYRERKEMAEIALQALRSQEEQEKPKPLTYEELIQMVGEPVYVTVPGKPHRNKWCLVHSTTAGLCLARPDYTLALDAVEFGVVVVYRTKPEEESL